MSSNDPTAPLPPDASADAAPTDTSASALPLVPTNPAALIEVVARGLAPDADPAAREAAWQVWTRFAPMIGTLVRSMPGANSTPIAMPAPTAVPAPIPTARLSPEQLLEVLNAQLRSRLPVGTTLDVPRGFQAQLVRIDK